MLRTVSTFNNVLQSFLKSFLTSFSLLTVSSLLYKYEDVLNLFQQLSLEILNGISPAALSLSFQPYRKLSTSFLILFYVYFSISFSTHQFPTRLYTIYVRSFYFHTVNNKQSSEQVWESWIFLMSIFESSARLEGK